MITIDYSQYLTLLKPRDTFETFYKSNPQFFENSYYKFQPIDRITMRYLNYLSAAFNIKTPQGQKIPYIPYSWQIDYHKNSLLLNGQNTKYDFVMKGRGISYSYSTMIEAINIAAMFPNTIIPVVAHRLQSARDLVNVARWLCENANIDIKINKDKQSELEIYTKYGKSIIRPYPSGTPTSVDAIRQLRPVLVVIDEAGFIKNLRELLTAAENSMQTKQTKIIVGGTPKGKANYFWEMYEKPIKGYNKYVLPAFEQPNVTIENIKNLKPLVWWYDTDKLYDILNNDHDAFNQEYMCSPYNDTDALIPLVDVTASYENDYTEDVEDGYILMGADVATSNDYAVVTAFKTNGIKFKQLFLKYYKKMLLDDFEDICRNLIEEYHPQEFRLDATGLGTQMGQRLRKDYSSCVKAVNFSSSIFVNNESINIKKYMCYNIRYLIQKNSVQLQNDALQTNHMTSVSKSLDFKSADGHNDIFIANALALMPLHFKYNPEFDIIDNNKIGEKINETLNEVLNFFRSKKHKVLYNDKGVIGVVE